MEPFVEVCSAQEMDWAHRLGAGLVGINNRNITALELDDGGPSRTASLAVGKPSGALLVSESGILSAGDARLAASAGVGAVLVGTALWQADDMESMYRSLCARSAYTYVKICGLKGMADIIAANSALPDYC